MKKLLTLWLMLIFFQQSNAQMDEASAVNSLKKIKCLAKMTNCKPRQAFYQSNVNYWQCYLDNNLNAKACESIFPTGQMPECPEDDLNFPPNQYTISYLDKCIASMPVVITMKPQSPVIAQQNPKNQSRPTETNEALLDISGLYFIGNDAQNTGNIGKRLEIQEERINNTDSQIAIFSEGQEVVSIRRRNNARVVSGYWDYVHEDPDPKFHRLRIKRLCEIKMNLMEMVF
ncbi:MAG: hypothetical protein U5N85_09915 [Arcicella sp.]|nr:hypothetical protein [Arcicella sp.]